MPERHGAYANAVIGKPYPSWAEPNLPPPADNLTFQSLSISFEGHAATIHRTMVRGGPQWNAGVALVAHRAKRLRINPDNWARHADVSIARRDPGSLDLVAFTLDVKAKLEDNMTNDELEAALNKLRADATAGDAGLRADLTKLRADATGADNAIRGRLDVLEGSPGSPTHTHMVPAHRTEEA